MIAKPLIAALSLNKSVNFDDVLIGFFFCIGGGGIGGRLPPLLSFKPLPPDGFCPPGCPLPRDVLRLPVPCDGFFSTDKIER